MALLRPDSAAMLWWAGGSDVNAQLVHELWSDIGPFCRTNLVNSPFLISVNLTPLLSSFSSS